MRASISQTVRQLGGGLAALGVRVDKPEVDIPTAGATVDLFIVRGGKILLTSLIGQVTENITDVGTVFTRLQHYHTTGVPGVTFLSSDGANLDIGGDVVPTMYIITGATGVPMEDDGAVGVYLASMYTNLLILQPGTIQLLCTGTETGKIKWLLHYIAVDPNAYVVPAP